MRRNLTPTAIVDRNGKRTTVHKAAQQQPARGTGALAAAQPTVTRPRSRPKASKITWTMQGIGAPWGKVNELDSESFLARAGLERRTLEASEGGKGSATVPMPTLFEYLRLGISPQEAAVLETLGTLDEWLEDPGFNSALPGRLARTRRRRGEPDYLVEVGDAVDRMERAGLTHLKAQALLENGLRDAHFENTDLTDEQVFAVFDRFKYQPSTVGAETNAAATIDAILDGRLPWRVVDKELGLRRVALARVVELIYPETWARGSKEEESLEESEKDWLREDPNRLVAFASQLSTDGRNYFVKGVLADAMTALRAYGAKACMEAPAELLLAERGDGRPFGPEGAAAAQEFSKAFEAASGRELNRQGAEAHYSGFPRTSDYQRKRLHFADVVDSMAAGLSAEGIVQLLHDGLTMAQVKAIAADGIATALVDGAL